MQFISKGEKEKKHRLIVLTDMENEPDDSQTLVHLLMYSNEIDIEGLIAVTSTWLQKVVFPESILVRVQGFGIVRKNLIKHATGYPTEEYLTSKIAAGQRGYGMAAVGDNMNTEGSELIISALEKDDERPIWFAINAGANTLAQALLTIRKTKTTEEAKRLFSKIRVYDDAGQDDAGAWICHEFPDIFYIRSKNQVFGLFGPNNDRGPKPWAPWDQYDWAELNIRTRHGILGALYPRRLFKNKTLHPLEGGGTTTWLGLVNKGLYEPEQISWGGWGGRFSWEKEMVAAGQGNVADEEHKYEPFCMYPQTSDTSFIWKEEDLPEEEQKNNAIFAPLWRWRNAYTNDLKARMDWCVGEFNQANHNPVVNLMGDENRTVAYFEADAGENVSFDASASWDPDNKIRIYDIWGFKQPDEKLLFNWFMYPEAGTYHDYVEIINNKSSIAEVKIPNDAKGKQIHIILEVCDGNQDAPMTSYRRIIINVK